MYGSPPDLETMLGALGYPQQPHEQSETMPPGGGKDELPHYMTFGQIVNWSTRVYRWTHDEALRHSRENALAVRRDPVVMEALRARQIPTAQLPWHLECEDDTDMAQAEAQAELTKVIERIPDLQTLKMQLLEALWYGRAGVNLVYQWDFSRGKKSLKVEQHYPINGDKLVFNYDGEVGIRVHATFTPPDGEQLAITDHNRAWMLRGNSRDHFIVHRYEPEDVDLYEPELAGGIQGKGIRDRIYWFWWVRTQVSAWLMDYLERIGAGGFTIYYFEAGNPQNMAEVKAAAEEQHRNNTILFPRYKDGSTGGPGIQRIEPSNAGAQLLQALVSNYFDQVIRRFILGQNLTSEAVGTGLGSGVADLHADTFARLVKYDAIALGETLTRDLVAVLQRVLFPGLPPLRFVFDVDKPNAADVLESAERFFNMGGAVDEDELRSVIGLARPQPGHAILAKMGAMQPAALGGGMPPMGMPMIGQPGPEMGMDPMGGMGGPGGAMDMAAYYSRPRRPLSRRVNMARTPEPYVLEQSEHWALLPHERDLMVSLCNSRDPDVAEMARQARAGDPSAMVMLHDALLDAGYAEDSPEVAAVIDMAADAISNKNRGTARMPSRPPAVAARDTESSELTNRAGAVRGLPRQHAMLGTNRALVGEMMTNLPGSHRPAPQRPQQMSRSKYMARPTHLPARIKRLRPTPVPRPPAPGQAQQMSRQDRPLSRQKSS